MKQEIECIEKFKNSLIKLLPYICFLLRVNEQVEKVNEVRILNNVLLFINIR